MYRVDAPMRTAYMVLAKLVTVLVTCIWRVLVVVSFLGTSGCCHRPATAAKSKEGNRIAALPSGELVAREGCRQWPKLDSRRTTVKRTSSCKQETKRDTQRNAR
jgi:hypothetical protein